MNNLMPYLKKFAQRIDELSNLILTETNRKIPLNDQPLIFKYRYELDKILVNLYPVRDMFLSQFPYLKEFYDENIEDALEHIKIHNNKKIK